MVSYKDNTLEEIDGKRWGEPEYTSSLVLNCYRLRRVPLKDFSVGDLRLMIGQGINLEYLVPLALEYLESDPLIEGSFYQGDLLNSVLGISREFWQRNPQLHRMTSEIAGKAKTRLNALDESEIKDKLKERLNAFE